MIWFGRTPWLRHLAMVALLLAALWSEAGRDATAHHPFAARTIEAGETISSENTRLESLPTGVLAEVELGRVATRRIEAGSPVLAADLDSEASLTKGLWVIEVDLPPAALPGTEAKLVDVGNAVSYDAIVVTVSGHDGLGRTPGTVAVGVESIEAVASALADQRLVVLVSTG